MTFNLIKDINAQVEQEQQLVKQYIVTAKQICENTSFAELNETELFEAVTHWLSALRAKADNLNALSPEDRNNFKYILAAILGLSDLNNAHALDERGDLGTVLYLASSNDKEKSNAALQRLMQIGKHPSLKQYVTTSEQALRDPEQLKKIAAKTQADIDKVMRTLLSSNAKNKAA